MIDTAIPNDSNVNTKETEKLSKYKNLEIKVSRMWKVRTKLGIVKRRSNQNLQLVPGHLSVIELHKIALMRTAHTIHNVQG
jgi:hypothetical protein